MYSWKQVAWTLSRKPPGTIWKVNKDDIGSPIAAGGQRHLGLPKGQKSDYRFLLPDCKGLHALDFGSYFEVHMDQTHPDCSLEEHLRKDAPQVYATGATAGGAAVGYLAAGARGALAGGAIGLAVSLLAIALTEE